MIKKFINNIPYIILGILFVCLVWQAIISIRTVTLFLTPGQGFTTYKGPLILYGLGLILIIIYVNFKRNDNG